MLMSYINQVDTNTTLFIFLTNFKVSILPGKQWKGARIHPQFQEEEKKSSRLNHAHFKSKHGSSAKETE